MNLTSKRILNGLAVCAGAFALTASAVTTWVSDSFEAADGGADGQAIKFFKAAQWGVGVDQTNYLWVADADDASKLVASNRTYAANSPIPEAADNLILQLDTADKTLTRYVDIHTNETATALVTNSVPFSATNTVYVDTLIKFVISEDPPSITDPDVKVAVFVNAESNLVVYHKVFDETFQNATKTNSVIADKTIDKDKWYRLTIKLGQSVAAGAPACQVWLDGGDPLTHTNAYQDVEGMGGSWFLLANDDASTSLTQISFQGTGAIDEFVVADAYAPFGGATAVMLTLSFDDTKVTVWNMDLDQVVEDDDTVATGTEIAINAIDWYQINSITGDGITYGGTLGEQVQSSTNTISASTEGCTATINVGTVTGNIGTGLGGDYENIDGAKLAAWAMAQDPALTQQDVENNAAAYLNDFLLNVAPGTDATIEITSIEVSGSTVTITVAATDDVNLGAINGFLCVVSSETLPVTGTATYIEFNTDEAGVATIEIPNSGNFIKATVLPLEPIDPE